MQLKKINSLLLFLELTGVQTVGYFQATMNIPKIKSYIDENFEVLYVDVKRYEINMSLMEEYGIEPAEGIPRLLVFDLNKKLINNSNTTEWRTARERTSQEIFNFSKI